MNRVLSIRRDTLIAAIHDEINDFFSDPQLAGTTLARYEVQRIAAGIVERATRGHQVPPPGTSTGKL